MVQISSPNPPETLNPNHLTGLGRWDEVARLYVRTRTSLDVKTHAHALMGLPLPIGESNSVHRANTTAFAVARGAEGDAVWPRGRAGDDGGVPQHAGEAQIAPLARVIGQQAGRRFLDPVLAASQQKQADAGDAWLRPGEVVWVVRPDLPPWPGVIAEAITSVQLSDLARHRRIGPRVLVVLLSTFEQPVVTPEILVPFPGPLRGASAAIAGLSKDMPVQTIPSAVALQIARGSTEGGGGSAWAMSRVIQANYRRAVSQLFRFLVWREEMGLTGGGLGSLDAEVGATVRRGGTAAAVDGLQLGEPGALSFNVMAYRKLMPKKVPKIKMAKLLKGNVTKAARSSRRHKASGANGTDSGLSASQISRWDPGSFYLCCGLAIF